MYVRFSARAERHLAELADHVQAETSPAGAAWISGLKESISSLALFPFLGKSLQKRSKLRRLLYGTGRNMYVVIYEVDTAAQEVTVGAIIHGRTRQALGYL